jgi:membrane protein YqaA with SNARE-associated domain
VALIAVVAGSLLFGVASGVIPVINAEAYLIATAGVSTPPTAVAVALAVGLGQTGGKILVFLAARRGSTLWLPRRRRRRAEHEDRGEKPPGRLRARLRDWGRRALELLDRPLLGGGVILVSAAVGVPPLAVTTVAAGLSRMRLLVFGLAALTGRTGWFLLVTLASDRLAGSVFGR